VRCDCLPCVPCNSATRSTGTAKQTHAARDVTAKAAVQPPASPSPSPSAGTHAAHGTLACPRFVNKSRRGRFFLLPPLPTATTAPHHSAAQGFFRFCARGRGRGRGRGRRSCRSWSSLGSATATAAAAAAYGGADGAELRADGAQGGELRRGARRHGRHPLRALDAPRVVQGGRPTPPTPPRPLVSNRSLLLLQSADLSPRSCLLLQFCSLSLSLPLARATRSRSS
jgi:hypothetical protein